MKAVIGLGNPETKYLKTRHNIGFMIVDKLLARNNIVLSDKFQSFFGKKDNVLYLLPKTYMNLSGRAVVELMNFYKLNIRDILVICDDTTLELGTLRFRKDGSHGGHNGLKSIINLTGSSDFDRLKAGVGPIPQNTPIENFVLGNFTSEESEKLDKITSLAADAVEEYLKTDIMHVQNKYNRKHCYSCSRLFILNFFK